MDFSLSNVLSVLFATLLLIVVVHIAVFFVVRHMYPPIPARSSQQNEHVYHPPPPSQQQEQYVELPTYEEPVSKSTEASREEGTTSLATLVESATIQRDERMDTPNA